MVYYPTKVITAVLMSMVLGPVFKILLAMNVLMFLDYFLVGMISWSSSWIILPLCVVSWIMYIWFDGIVMEYVNSGQYDEDKREAEKDERS